MGKDAGTYRTHEKKTTLGIFIADEKEFRGIWMEHT